jgi:glycosyltransferase involved in cell wall biosynthesis
MNDAPRKQLLFVTGRGRLDPASHKRVYDLLLPLERLGYRAEIASVEWELLWSIRKRVQCGDTKYKYLMRGLNAMRVLPVLVRARTSLALGRLDRLARSVDAVIVNQHFLDAETRRLLRSRARFVVYELDDAVWLRDEAAARAMIDLSDLVVAGNEFLADYVRPFHADVAVIPTGVRLDRYPERLGERSPDGKLRVGWVGSPSTAKYLEILTEPLREVGRRIPVEFVVVGTADAELPAFTNVDLRTHPAIPYDPAAFVPGFDVGVMPLFDGDAERGKCGAKALEYMAAGVPAVCSPVGVNREIVEHGVSGFLAAGPAEWADILATLARDAALRHRVGAAGRERVRLRYSSDVVAAMWDECLRPRLGGAGERPRAVRSPAVGALN